jgi:hypothetical protein
MVRNQFLLLGSALALTACATGPQPTLAPAPDGTAAPVDHVWFTGASNIRRFTCNAKQVYVSAEAAPENFARTRADGVPAVRSAAFSVPVRSLDCGIGLQNAHLFEALGATANPNISFTLSDYTMEPSENVRRVRMNGTLRIAGVERSVVVRGIVLRSLTGELMLRGERDIDVRDFGVKPPRRFLGLLRVRNEVTVHFEVVVRPLIDPLGVLATALQ